MYKIKVHDQINKICSVFYFMRYWGYYQWSNCRKWGMTIVQVCIPGCYMASFAIGTFICEDMDEQIYLVVCSIISGNLTFRLYTFIRKQEQIRQLLHEVCTHSIKDYKEFVRVDEKINYVMKITHTYMLIIISTVIILVPFMPFGSDERRLPFNAYYPLDWKNSEIAYWTIFAFIVLELCVYIICVLCNLIVWYLMIGCTTKYQTLGSEFQKIFSDTTSSKKIATSVAEKQRLFLEKLLALIKSHLDLRKYTSFTLSQ